MEFSAAQPGFVIPCMVLPILEERSQIWARYLCRSLIITCLRTDGRSDLFCGTGDCGFSVVALPMVIAILAAMLLPALGFPDLLWVVKRLRIGMSHLRGGGSSGWNRGIGAAFRL